MQEIYSKILFAIVFIASVNVSAAVEFQGQVTGMFAEGGIVRATICSSASNCKSFWLKPENDYSNTIFAMLLSAKISKNDVWIQGYDNPVSEWPYNGAYKFASLHLR